MSDGVNIPEDIIVDILYRLPLKSLCRLKCVSSGWLTLISDPRFAKTHLNRNNRRESLILRSSGSPYSIDCTEATNNDVVMATELDLPEIDFPSIYGCEIMGSCDGLILLVHRERNIKFLWNPSTRDFEKLPKSHLYRKPVPQYRMYGLGYDSSGHDYKVVEVRAYERHTYLYYYSLRIGCWRQRWISVFPYAGKGRGVHVSGSVHWFASNVICAFDLTHNEFRDVSLPSFPYNKSGKYIDLGVLGGCLTVIVCWCFSNTDFWVMKEYGATETWTKFTIKLQNRPRSLTPFSLVDGIVLLENDGEKLVACNSKVGKKKRNNASRDIMVHGIPSTFRAEVTYVKSLLSPRYNCGVKRNDKGTGNLKQR